MHLKFNWFRNHSLMVSRLCSVSKQKKKRWFLTSTRKTVFCLRTKTSLIPLKNNFENLNTWYSLMHLIRKVSDEKNLPLQQNWWEKVHAWCTWCGDFEIHPGKEQRVCIFCANQGKSSDCNWWIGNAACPPEMCRGSSQLIRKSIVLPSAKSYCKAHLRMQHSCPGLSQVMRAGFWLRRRESNNPSSGKVLAHQNRKAEAGEEKSEEHARNFMYLT